MKILKTGLLATSLVLASTYVAAQNPDRPKRGGQRPTTDEIFLMMDSNEDGQLAESELKGPLKNNFSRVDTDGDGFLSVEELENAPKPSGRRRQRSNDDNQ